jgi:hypothetical protein
MDTGILLLIKKGDRDEAGTAAAHHYTTLFLSCMYVPVDNLYLSCAWSISTFRA